MQKEIRKTVAALCASLLVMSTIPVNIFSQSAQETRIFAVENGDAESGDSGSAAITTEPVSGTTISAITTTTTTTTAVSAQQCHISVQYDGPGDGWDCRLEGTENPCKNCYATVGAEVTFVVKNSVHRISQVNIGGEITTYALKRDEELPITVTAPQADSLEIKVTCDDFSAYSFSDHTGLKIKDASGNEITDSSVVIKNDYKFSVEPEAGFVLESIALDENPITKQEDGYYHLSMDMNDHSLTFHLDTNPYEWVSPAMDDGNYYDFNKEEHIISLQEGSEIGLNVKSEKEDGLELCDEDGNILDEDNPTKFIYGVASLEEPSVELSLKVHDKQTDEYYPIKYTFQTYQIAEPTIWLSNESGTEKTNMNWDKVYSEDVYLKVEAQIPESGYYPAIKTIQCVLLSQEGEELQIVKATDGLIHLNTSELQGEYSLEFYLADKDGNSTTLRKKIKINSIAPTMQETEYPDNGISYSYNDVDDIIAVNGDTVTCTFTIMDDPVSWDENGVIITTFKKKNEPFVNENYERWAHEWISGKPFDEHGEEYYIKDHFGKFKPEIKWVQDSDSSNLYHCQITFTEDAYYAIKIEYTNKAGKSFNEPFFSKLIQKDNVAPTGKMNNAENPQAGFFEKIVDGITDFINWLFGNTETQYNMTNLSDDFSGVNSCVYYRETFDDVSEFRILSNEELETLYSDGAFSPDASVYTLTPDIIAVVYARIDDKAGNVYYQNSKGIILEEKSSADIILSSDFELPLTEDTDNPVITVDVNNVAPGIQSISYQYLDKNDNPISVQGNDNYTLYKHVEGKVFDTSFSGEIELPITNDSNNPLNRDDIKVQVTVKDMAENSKSAFKEISVNTDNPYGEVHFSTADNSDELIKGLKLSYNRGAVSATVVLFDERDKAFNPDVAQDAILAAITCDDEPIAIDDVEIGEWSSTIDGTQHSITLTFRNEGCYSWKKTQFNDKVKHTVEITPKATEDTDKVSVTLDHDGNAQLIIDMTNPECTIEQDGKLWDKILNAVTFGWYTKNKTEYTFTLKPRDNWETECYYFIQKFSSESDIRYLSSDELDMQFWEEYEEESGVKVDVNSVFVLYAKIIDNAGNYAYFSTGGYIIDSSPCNIRLTPQDVVDDNPILVGYDFTKEHSEKKLVIDVSVNDGNVDEELKPSSGIQSVSYQIRTDGAVPSADDKDWEILQEYSYDDDADVETAIMYDYSAISKKYDGQIFVDLAEYNSSNTVVYVKAVDFVEEQYIDETGQTAQRQAHTTIEKLALDIDITAPTISVEYDNNDCKKVDAGGREYYSAARTATISVQERDNHFDDTQMRNCIKMTKNGEPFNPTYDLATVQNDSPDQVLHIYSIEFKDDANYTLEIAGYEDNAGNPQQVANLESNRYECKFTVDTTAPTLSMTAVSSEGRSMKYEKLISDSEQHFGFWAKSSINVVQESMDVTSPIDSISYYKVSGNAANTMLTLDSLRAVTTWTPWSDIAILPDERCVIYLRVVDYAGNAAYISTNGLLVDHTIGDLEIFKPNITVTPQQTESGIYNGDVSVEINVEEPVVNNAYSGIKSVSYIVKNMGTETKNENLYSFAKENPKFSELQQAWNKKIVVDSHANNSNDVIVYVRAEDNAGNVAEKQIALKIDITAPDILVTYENNTAIGNYFNQDRTAVIQVTERNFDAKYFDVTVTQNQNAIAVPLNWTKTEGTQNGDNTRWTATIPFTTDGDYTFAISGTDMAANTASFSFADGTVCGNAFTLDKTAPVVNVTYNNTQLLNGKYFMEKREATITVTEHNFDAAAATAGITLTAKNNGADIQLPKISAWTSNGDTHVAKISYVEDGQYTFGISFKDMAGNVSSAYANETFVIDTASPSLSITVNGSNKDGAYSGRIVPTIVYDDLNLNPALVSITLNGLRVKTSSEQKGDELIFTMLSDDDPSHTEIYWHSKVRDTDKPNGKSIIFENFPTGSALKPFDDIYTLSVSVTDMAGRETSQSLRFSVNRYGSTYDISKVKDILGTYQKEPMDIVFSEINISPLSNISMTVFKDNSAIQLKKDIDFTVTEKGGENEWHEYTYTLKKSNFSDDGVYRIVSHSVDDAGNVSENTLDTKNTELNFGIDKTPPIVSASNLSGNKTYAEETYRVMLSADDNLKLQHLVAMLDGQTVAEWSEEQIAEYLSNADAFEFSIPGDSTHAHKVSLRCVDAAGNETIVDLDDIYVTTNLWVRFIHNAPLFYGSIAGVVALLGLLVFLIRKKKKA